MSRELDRSDLTLSIGSDGGKTCYAISVPGTYGRTEIVLDLFGAQRLHWFLEGVIGLSMVPVATLKDPDVSEDLDDPVDDATDCDPDFQVKP